ncbi:peptidase M28 [Aliidiomarina iranensis]|uniref:Peptidase M28 n=1 Tax=Aliidiomarina iranensis TaxID=1434071 RepID=A0A432W1I7_9GAMM|nr:M28 family metallopeptidase [Aliidiomarina iranensis]RUO23094.1 peptidase M28 [Aliidiomarina iranensis]
MRHLTLCASALFLVAACAPATETDVRPYPPQTDAEGLVDSHFTDTYRSHLETLSSDEFEGRAPGTRGEELTIEYITDIFRELGVTSLTNEDYTQAVPLVRIAPSRVTDMALSHNGEESSLEYRTEMMGWTNRVVDSINVENSEMVFVGYGIVAPEFGWNDYEGLDVAGKTVVMFVNDPGYATQDPAVFNGNAMTYYGRWTYKFEEAARQGATGAIVIHEDGPAGYGWGVIAGGSPVRFTMKTENRNMHRAELEGWVNADAAEKLFANAGMSLEEAHELALSSDFTPVSLNTEVSMIVENEFSDLDTYNIVGMIEGSKYPEEHIIYMAHWDHMGVDPISGEIFNGAQDNATGTAGLLAMAEKFAAGEQPERSIVFAFVGAEERGLLGSAWYGENPLLPLEKTVAGINIDMLYAHGPVKDFVVVGWNNSDMQNFAEPHVIAQNRYLAPEGNPEAGIFYRSDHFSLAKQGVPVLYAKGGVDHFFEGPEYGQREVSDFLANRYHKVADKFNPEWDLRGIHQDLWVFFRVGNDLANSRVWPQWAEGNEFEALRLESEAQRN